MSLERRGGDATTAETQGVGRSIHCTARWVWRSRLWLRRSQHVPRPATTRAMDGACWRRIHRTARHLLPAEHPQPAPAAAEEPPLLSTTSLDFAPASGPPGAEILRQTDILYDPATYSAFPHVIRLEGEELLLSLRQAPATKVFHHTHPSSIITLIRSNDSGRTWDLEGATQMAAGGGQELGLIHLGGGLVGGCLAAHEVVRQEDSSRAVTYAVEDDEPGGPAFSYGNQRASWVWSSNYGLTVRPAFPPSLPPHPHPTPGWRVDPARAPRALNSRRSRSSGHSRTTPCSTLPTRRSLDRTPAPPPSA